jgi:vacuolar-type H+-ATPase subunit C/Vma6
MLSKYVELENIRAIVRGKEAKLSEETIRDYIVL